MCECLLDQKVLSLRISRQKILCDIGFYQDFEGCGVILADDMGLGIFVVIWFNLLCACISICVCLRSFQGKHCRALPFCIHFSSKVWMPATLFFGSLANNYFFCVCWKASSKACQLPSGPLLYALRLWCQTGKMKYKNGSRLGLHLETVCLVFLPSLLVCETRIESNQLQ